MVINHMILGSAGPTDPDQFSEHGVQNAEQAQPDLRSWRWDDLQLLTTLAESASFRRAASHMGVSVNTVRARLDRLEFDVGATLFRRDAKGIALSAEGSAWLNVATEMRAASSRLPGRSGNALTLKPGEISIGCSEGLGEFWLTPRLPSLIALLPNYTVSLRNEIDQRQVHQARHDISLGFVRPEDPDAVIARVASLHFMIYASDSYIRTYGEPKVFEDARQHRFVIQEAPGLHGDAIALFLGTDLSSRLAAVKVNTSYSMYRAVADGVGIGALPTYVRAVTRKVRPLSIPVQLKFDLWMSYKQSLRRSEPLRRTIDWVRECFDPVAHPWFSDKFVHPDSFDSIILGNIVTLHDSD